LRWLRLPAGPIAHKQYEHWRLNLFRQLQHRYQVFLVCATGIFITVFDTSSAIVALPTIALEFGASLPTAQWVIIGNGLIIAALLVPVGGLSDLIGRKRIYVIGCCLFAAGAVLSAFAMSIYALIAARALVGIGSAMTQGTAMAILVGNFDVRERAKMLGLQMGGVGLGAMAGPATGGIVVGTIGWRMLFAITALAMLVIAIASQRILIARAQRPSVDRPTFDYPGAILFSGLLVAGLLTLTLGPQHGWLRPGTLTGIALFFLLCAAFYVVEKRQKYPMLDFDLFRNSSFALGALGSIVAFMCISSTRYLAPFFLQGVKGFDPSRVGLLMLPAATVTAIAAPFAGRWADRFGIRLFANIGFGTALIGLGMFCLLAPDTATWTVVAALMVLALGMSTFSAPNSASILNSVTDNSHGVAAGFVNLCRNTGNVIGIAFATAIVTLTMSGSGFAPSLSSVDAQSGQGVFAAFTRGVQISSLSLLALALPMLIVLVIWSSSAWRRGQRAK
jgi:EmrB/QacA subfamily drug resistance transporter